MAEDLVPALEALGLVARGRWTVEAECVLWRCLPKPLGLDVVADPRFLAAVDRVVHALPGDIRAEIARLATITEPDIGAARESLEERAAELKASRAEQAARPGAGKVAPIPPRALTPQALRGTVKALRSHQLNWIFFRRWRFPDGWLSEAEAARALNIFHDPLAIAMRQAVMARLHPGWDTPG